MLQVEEIAGRGGGLAAVRVAEVYAAQDAARMAWLDAQCNEAAHCPRCGERHGYPRDDVHPCRKCRKAQRKERRAARLAAEREQRKRRRAERLGAARERRPAPPPRKLPPEPRVLDLDLDPRPVTVLVEANPHRPGSWPAEQFSILASSPTVGAFLAAGGQRRYLYQADFHGWMRVGR